MGPEPIRRITPDEFSANFVPVVVERWQQRCFCRNPQFCKLVSFNFADYGVPPAALFDSETLIDELIRRRFTSVGEPVSANPGVIQLWRCPQCGAEFREEYAEFSISMYRSFVRRADERSMAPVGHYLVGFHGFQGFTPERVVDFKPAESAKHFLDGLTAAG